MAGRRLQAVVRGGDKSLTLSFAGPVRISLETGRGFWCTMQRRKPPGDWIKGWPMRLRFWGVRGSTPTPQMETMRFGGNTPCLDIRSDGGALLIVDCGSGMRMLGKALDKEFGGRPIRGQVLLSHYHWDHIQGLPFFAPIYEEKNQFHFYSYSLPGPSLEEALQGQMTDPYFPVSMNEMHSIRTFTEIQQGPFQIEDFIIEARRVNHPQGCLSFRIEHNGKAVHYATDNEPGNPESDKAIRELARDADLIIYDSQYTRQQLEQEKKGWGHSTWEEGVAICEEVGVKELILFHHDPDSDDATVELMERTVRARFPNSRAAFEGMEIVL
jgi:phosphoribosyl 1,2-cyclic phosphodiesterase